MIVTKTVNIQWSNPHKKHYESKGYKFTKVHDFFNVDVNDLKPTSSATVEVICERCKKTRKTRYMLAVAGLECGNLCRQCVQPEIMSNGNKTWLSKYGSLYDFCIENIGGDFIEKYWSDRNAVHPRDMTRKSRNMIWIKCQNKNYHDDYQVSCAHFTKGDRCPQCRWGTHPLDSLGAKINKIYGDGTAELRWSENNVISPFSMPPTSHKNVWFTCPLGMHEDYSQSITNAARTQYDCPMCARDKNKSRLQVKVEEYIASKYSFAMAFEGDCSTIARNYSTGRKMPYDIEILGLNILVEVNGVQHYNETTFHLKDGESKEKKFSDQVERDRMKKQHAINHGYTYLEIPYWTEKDESYKQLIDEAILSAQKAVSLCS